MPCLGKHTDKGEVLFHFHLITQRIETRQVSCRCRGEWNHLFDMQSDRGSIAQHWWMKSSEWTVCWYRIRLHPGFGVAVLSYGHLFMHENRSLFVQSEVVTSVKYFPAIHIFSCELHQAMTSLLPLNFLLFIFFVSIHRELIGLSPSNFSTFRWYLDRHRANHAVLCARGTHAYTYLPRCSMTFWDMRVCMIALSDRTYNGWCSPSRPCLRQENWQSTYG